MGEDESSRKVPAVTGPAGTDGLPEPCVHPRDVRTAIRRAPLVDGFLCARYSFSPYMACGHGCRYCDGRAEKYWVEGDFERDIVVRRNLPDLLSRELPKLRERAPIGIGSGISDAYQPLERAEGLMQACAGILSDSPLPVTLLTKSALVRRDAALWEKVNRSSGFILNISLATLDESVRQRFEPGAGTVTDRLDTIAEFTRRGIPVGVMAMPLLPFISDGEKDIRSLVTALKEAGAAFVMPGGLTLRPGRQKDFFMARLAEAFPGLLPRYRQLYAEERPSGSCLRSYRDELAARSAAATDGLGVPFLLPHALYRDRFPLYDELHLLLLHMAELYAARGVAVGGLKTATRRYAEWLLAKKKLFYRRRSMEQGELEEETRALFATGNAREVLGNARLAGFLASVACERRVLDYLTLALQGAREDEGGGPASGGPARAS
jgi:DNA repair photolyase